jgi:RNA polymerase sigma-70 factor (ECF subfamily)
MMGRRLPFSSQVESPKALAEYTEDELLAEAVDFSEAALSELYDRYELKIFSYIYRRTNDQTLAEDLTAQVFLKMLEAIRNERAWHSSFSGWLYRIAHNLVIDHYRRRDRQQQVALDDAPILPDFTENPVETAELRIDAEMLRAAIRRLTEDQAQVVSLRFLEGYSFGEIAEMMDKTEGAVKALQHRAFATLRQYLQYEYLP